MSDFKKRFTDRVEDYVKYRPSYPAALFQFLKDELKIDHKTNIADIGSGTGISAKLLLESGAKVFAVEPNENMRMVAEKDLCKYPDFVSVEGSAEQTHLPDESIDIIVCAQAFHWFANEQTQAEFKRILKKDSSVVLIWNDRDETDAFQAAYEKIIQQYNTDYNRVAHKNITDERIQQFFGTALKKYVYTYEQLFNFVGLIGRITSSSYMPQKDSQNFQEMQTEVRNIFEKYAQNNQIVFRYTTRVFIMKF